VYRAVDQFERVVDVVIAARRDANAAHRFFEHALGATKVSPIEVVTDQAPVYPGVVEEPPPAWHYRPICRQRRRVQLRPTKARLRPLEVVPDFVELEVAVPA
jgi:transposase-like protein